MKDGDHFQLCAHQLQLYPSIASIAEYMALACSLKVDSPPADYRRANQLSWELALWMPADLYRKMGRAIAAPTEADNPMSVIIAVRTLLIGSCGPVLLQNDVIGHAPGAGLKKGTA